MKYPRDYKKENEARRMKYKRFEVNVEELESVLFRKKLEQNNLSFMEWCRNCIKEYMKNDK